MSSFIPDDFDLKAAEVPWFEDASAELGIKGHGTRKSIETLKTEVKAAMSSMGGGVSAFLNGRWPGKPLRYGYEIRFAYGSREGRIQIATLPMRHETPGKKEQALKQALYTVRDALEAQFNAGILMPGNAPLVGYLLDDHGRTMGEVLSGEMGVPLLSPPIIGGDDPGGNDQEPVDADFREDV